MKKYTFISIILLLMLVPPLIAIEIDWEYESFSATIEITPNPRDTREEIRQIAFLQAKFKAADEILAFLISEYGLDEYLPSADKQQEFALNSIRFWEVSEEWLESENPTLRLTYEAKTVLNFIYKGLENAADNPSFDRSLSEIYTLNERLLNDMLHLRDELAAADYDEVKSIRGRRNLIGKQFTALEWYEKTRNFFHLNKPRDNDKRIECLTNAIELQPEWAFLYSVRADAYQNKQDNPELDRALVDISKAIELEPDDISYYSARGYTYQRMRIYDKSLRDFDRVVEARPEYAQGYRSRASTYKQMNKNKKALKDLARAIELEPDNVFNYTSRAYVYFNLGKFDEALEDFSRAIEIEPESEYGYAGRANVHMRMEEYQKAVDDCTKAIEISPDKDYYYTFRGNAYLLMGDEENARKDLKKAAEMGNKQAKDLLRLLP
ncbi:MAG: tetratricopeptide repeat protein [candidate division Zixibacteria bacterium]|nr:tetratricopeptide repeat protein [Candidatus Tariuqbacter arcticus]